MSTANHSAVRQTAATPLRMFPREFELPNRSSAPNALGYRYNEAATLPTRTIGLWSDRYRPLRRTSVEATTVVSGSIRVQTDTDHSNIAGPGVNLLSKKKELSGTGRE